MKALFDPAPDFSQPIAVLKHCHDRIRKQLDTLGKLPVHLTAHGADLEAKQAATAVLRYFEQAAPLHHQDEELDLLPMLQSTVQGDDAVALARLLPEIMQEHQQMDALWHTVNTALRGVAEGRIAVLPVTAIEEFSTMYQDHMHKEESTLAPMAKRLFDTEQMDRLGSAMQQRRGISAHTGSGHVDR